MVLTLAIILALVLPYPANLVVLVLGAAGEVGEIVWGRRLAKRWRPKVGPETMIGQTAVVVESCRPVGQVRLHGELWEARCAAGAAVGETVRIAALEGLTLTVAPVLAGESTVTPGTPGPGRAEP
jgi:membrane protein implicated in regulation of membrane protease activity